MAETRRERAGKQRPYRYAVVPHRLNSGKPNPAGGYVVRSIYDGGGMPHPYRLEDAVAKYRSETAAQRYADKLNGYA